MYWGFATCVMDVLGRMWRRCILQNSCRVGETSLSCITLEQQALLCCLMFSCKQSMSTITWHTHMHTPKCGEPITAKSFLFLFDHSQHLVSHVIFISSHPWMIIIITTLPARQIATLFLHTMYKQQYVSMLCVYAFQQHSTTLKMRSWNWFLIHSRAQTKRRMFFTFIVWAYGRSHFPLTKGRLLWSWSGSHITGRQKEVNDKSTLGTQEGKKMKQKFRGTSCRDSLICPTGIAAHNATTVTLLVLAWSRAGLEPKVGLSEVNEMWCSCSLSMLEHEHVCVLQYNTLLHPQLQALSNLWHDYT